MSPEKTKKRPSQPNIRIDCILLVESKFKRLPNLPKELITDMKMSVKNNLFDEDKKLACQVSFHLSTTKKEVEIKCIYVGLFNQPKPGNITLKQFANYNAPAMIYPYIREFISNIVMKAQLPPLLLPPINFTAILKKSEITT